ncbi:unconventional myosin-IXb isoform X2 [Engraulis encrasicolus]|uniref:unconventional myosin-IXb isoform X2 n=1 Tax=Engraulis encrasicolus TaxID=184585 RepID=UPI002FD155BC
MSVTDDERSTNQDEEVTFVLQIYPRLSPKDASSSSPSSSSACCTLSVPKSTSAASVIQQAVATLGLGASAGRYVLVEVRECGGEEWILQPGDRPMQRLLLWPRKAQEQHAQSDGYFFALQEGQRDDGSISYDHLALVSPASHGLLGRGFLPPQQEQCDDLCNLPVLTEESILEALRGRFREEKIYTYASNILIAINPFKFLPIYNPKYVKMYEHHQLGRLPPHVFAIADAAFYTMLKKRVDQAVIISGESGSGKTQSTNFLIHCLTALSQKGYTSGVERTILGAGPVLEAFGNAKTAHNNNSSRFGKFIQVNYSESGVVRGAVVEKYLLEKCRLVSREKSERNYHVFYYLLLGASEQEHREFKLLQPEDYLYLKQENFQSEDREENKHEFKRLQQAMEMVGFLPATKKQIFSVLSAILYLGNVTYEPTEDGEGLTVGPPDVLATLSDLLKVKRELLVEALTKRKAMTANDTLILPYSLSEAVTARDSVAKSLYGSLFDWIVLRINHALLNKKDIEVSIQCLSIGVLDIFGFEDFKVNSFEQFCINYANEQLQYYCNQHIFTLEQAEYQAEGIVWDNIDYNNNIGCIHLISKKPTGLFHLLDEESNFPHATDDTLLAKFKQQHQGHPSFVPTPVLEPAFIIKHFAGKVKYQIKDFREKNTDHMRPDIVALLRSSERSFLRQLIGADPVAVFRWGILRATIRSLAAFNEAGRRWITKHPDRVRRYSRQSMGEKRKSSPMERMMSQSCITEFSFDRSEEVPLEVFEDIFATFEKKKVLHDQGCTSVRLQSQHQSAVFHRRKPSRLSVKNRGSRHKQIIPKNLIDSKSLKHIVGLTLHNRVSRSLLHLHTKKKPPSISAQFQSSLSKLLGNLKKAEPFFVRCIRSNAEKLEMQFDEALVLRQLRYTGMLETVCIRRSGYGAKYTFKEFVNHFQVLLPKKVQSPKEDITSLLQKLDVKETNYQIGQTKVFLRESERQRLQETLHRTVMKSITTLQRWFKACLMRKHYLYKKDSAIIIQRAWRNFSERRRWKAARLIQSMWRESHQRAEYLSRRESFKKMQKLAMRRRTLSEEEKDKAAEDQGKAAPGDKQRKPLPPVPESSSSGSQEKLNGEDEEPRGGKGGEEEEGKHGQDPSALKDGSDQPKKEGESEEPYSTSSLQRYTKTADMKEKAEKWRERRSEEGQQETSSPDVQRPQHLRLKGLQSQGKSISLDNVSKISSSESDSSGSPAEVKVRYRKRPKRKRRLAQARSGLVFKSSDKRDVEFWSFPLPPISPAVPTRASIGAVLLERRVKFHVPTEPDGSKGSTQRRKSESTCPSQPTTPERGGFFSKFRKKRASTPEDGRITMAKTLAEREQVGSSPYSPRSGQPSGQSGRVRRNPTIKISRATRVQEQWNASLDRQISDTDELRHLDEFLGNQMNDLRNRGNEISETERIFLMATNHFREQIKSMYSSKPSIGYKALMKGYESRVSSLAGSKKAEVQLVVNLFQSVLDGFIRGEMKKEVADPVQFNKKSKQKRKKDKCMDSPLDHLFSTYQVTIMQTCDLCGSYIWGMEKACMCSSCKMVCHKKCLGKIITDCSTRTSMKNENEPGTLHFGVHVCALTNKSTPVPMVIEMLLQHVEMNGLYTEGIYRKSGSACRGRELHQILETNPKSAHLENYPIHTITGLIKRWLRELPDPLMTYNLYSDFLHAAELPEQHEQLRAVYRLTEELPQSHFNTLERLVFHLVRVAREEQHNRMSANSLAIVFAPCILRCPDSSDPFLSMKDVGKTTTCVEILINEQARKYNVKMEEIQQLEYAEALAVNQLKLRRQNTVNERAKCEMDTISMESEKVLIERIKSLKQEKDDLTFRLPDLDQEQSDDNLDSESSISSESLLDDRGFSLDSEGKTMPNPSRCRTEGPSPQGSKLKSDAPCSPDARQKRPSKHRDGTQSLYVIDQDVGGDGTPCSGDASSPKVTRRFSDLDIPFIDDDV